MCVSQKSGSLWSLFYVTHVSVQPFRWKVIPAKRRGNIKIVILIERTNKMQPCSRIYYSNVS
jgi:hypothetical protein